MLVGLLGQTVVLVCLAFVLPGAAGAPPDPSSIGDPSRDAGAASPASLSPELNLRVGNFWVHVPSGAARPLRVLVALHGMSGSGEEMAQMVGAQTDDHGWAVVAPTFSYGDWRDPAQVRREAGRELPLLFEFLDGLPDIVGSAIEPQVFFYGFSRGGQDANRFALAYPERVAGVAIIASGTYTLPFEALRGDDGNTTLPLPYGVADLPEVMGRSFRPDAFATLPFWIGVGSLDANPSDVPHQWDKYLGGDRVQRARAFGMWLRAAGASARVQIFPGVGHRQTDEMRAAAMRFLGDLDPRSRSS
jgi:poly(3-hydroxybutyrate) depolymerase